MIIRETKNTLNIITAVASGKLQLLILALFVALFIVLFSINGIPPRGITPLLSIIGGLFWFMMGSGILLNAHHAYQLRLAGVQMQVLRTLLLVFFALAVIPVLFAKPFVGALAVNIAIGATILLLLMTPPKWLLFTILLPVFISPKLGFYKYLPIDFDNPYSFWLITIPIVIAAWLRWRMMRQQDTSSQRNATLLTAMRSGAGFNISDPMMFQRGQLAWLSPRVKSYNVMSLTARLRTLLGMPFAPGAWLRHAIFNLMVFLGLGLFVELSNRFSPATSDGFDNHINLFFVSEWGIAILVTLSCLGMVFTTQLLYRKESHDLAELTLLPNLAGTQQLHFLQRAALQAGTLQGLGVVISLLLLTAWFHQFTPAKLIITCGSVALCALIVTSSLLQYAAHQQPKHAVLRNLAWAIAIFIASSAWSLAVQSVFSLDTLWLLVSLGILSAWFLIVITLRSKWQARVAARPHPYMEAY